MTNSYSPGLTWIAICTTISLIGVQGGAQRSESKFASNFVNCKCENHQNISLVNDSDLLERNRRAFEGLYMIRNKKESEDPLNYLSQLSMDLTEPCYQVASLVNDRADAIQGIVDPPQMELQFHKKVPNCENEFNISKIVELVNDDKKQRQCPCAACPKPAGTCGQNVKSYASGQLSNVSNAQLGQFALPTTQGPSYRSTHAPNAQASHLPTNVGQFRGFHSPNGTYESSTLKSTKIGPKSPSGSLGIKKDEKQKSKQNNINVPKTSLRKISNTGGDSKKNSFQNRPQSSFSARQGTGLISTKNSGRQQQSSAKQGHTRIADLRPIKIPLTHKFQGATVIN